MPVQVTSTPSRLPRPSLTWLQLTITTTRLLRNASRLLVILRRSIGACRIWRGLLLSPLSPECYHASNCCRTIDHIRRHRRDLRCGRRPLIYLKRSCRTSKTCCCGVVPSKANLKREQGTACTCTGACMSHRTNHRSLRPYPAAR
jgi:hypothetical protein